MNQPKVSVIIPTFNRTHYLREAIASIMAQTVPVDEIIVVDDGSTDDTRKMVMAYGHPVRYLWQKNQGPSAARNHGIREAKGDWIAFLDSDDLWVPEKNKIQMEFIRLNSHLDFVFGNLCNFSETHTEDKPEILNDTVQQYLVAHATDLKDLFQNLLICNPVPPSSVFIRRDCVSRIGFFDETMRYSEDYDYWLRVASCCRSGFIDQILVKRRIHDSNAINAHGSLYAGTLKVLKGWSKKEGLSPDVCRMLLKRIASLQYDLSSYLIKQGKFKAARTHLAELTIENLNPSATLRMKICFKTALVALLAGMSKPEIPKNTVP